MKKRISVFLLCLCMLAALAGCSSNSNTYRASASYDYADVKAEESYYGGFENSSAEAPAESAPLDTDSQLNQNSDPSLVERKLIRNIDMQMETLDFDETISIINDRVHQLGGYVQSSQSYNRNSYSNSRYISRSAYYEIRIPAAKLDIFVNEMGNVGNVTSKSMSSRDITLNYIDTQSRADALAIQQQKLLELLEKAETVEEIIALEDRISEVTYELENNKSILKNYDSLVSFSTVTINIEEVQRVTEVQTEPETVGQRISRGLSDTFYDIAEGSKDFAVWFVVNLPYLLIWAAVITVIVIIIIMTCRRAKAKRQSDTENKKEKKKKSKKTEDEPAETAVPETVNEDKENDADKQ